MSDKQKNIHLLNSISDNSSYKDFMYNLYLQNEISEGLKDIKDGNTYTIEEIKEFIINYKK